MMITPDFIVQIAQIIVSVVFKLRDREGDTRSLEPMTPHALRAKVIEALQEEQAADAD